MIGFDQIYKMAVDLINYTVSARGYAEPNLTVCVLVSKSGRVFNGVSHNEVHAEIEAVRNMQSFNETAVESLILVEANSRLAMLPCINCIRYIISLNPVNAAAMVNMPDRPVAFQEILGPMQGAARVPSTPLASPVVSATRSSMVMTGRSKSALLSGKVNNLLAAAQETQTEEDQDLLDELSESTKKKKGLFGGLFGKK